MIPSEYGCRLLEMKAKRRSARQKQLKYALYLLCYLICQIFIYCNLQKGPYSRWALPMSFYMLGLLHSIVLIGVLSLRRSWGALEFGLLPALILTVRYFIIYTCADVVIVCIIGILLKRVLGLRNWRVSAIQRTKLVVAIGIVLWIGAFLFYGGMLAYFSMREKKISQALAFMEKEYAASEAAWFEEARALEPLQEAERNARQRKSWEKMKQQRREAERRKAAVIHEEAVSEGKYGQTASDAVGDTGTRR